MMGMMGGRLLAISSFLVFLSFFLKQDGLAFYAFIAFAYIITIPYSLWLRNQDRLRQLAPLQFLVDLVLVSGLVYFAGGQGHDFLILLYPLIILSAGIILPLKQTIQVTLLAIVSYSLVILLMSQNILVDYASKGASQGVNNTPKEILLQVAIFVIFGIASAYVSQRCDYISKKEKQFREITHIIFENVKTGLLLLNSDNEILMANHRACVLLGRDKLGLLDKRLSSIHLKPSELQDSDTDLRGASDYFRRADGSVFPVSIEDALLSLPSEAVPHAKAKANTLINTRILNFNDLSTFLRLQGETRQIERIKVAATMAKEMAHQIRTPLTGISGAVQRLQFNLKKPAGEEIEKEREEICQQITRESARMDRVIQKFIDCAEFSPKEIQDFIQMDIDQETEQRV